jgi:hypothetical protein
VEALRRAAPFGEAGIETRRTPIPERPAPRLWRPGEPEVGPPPTVAGHPYLYQEGVSEPTVRPTRPEILQAPGYDIQQARSPLYLPQEPVPPERPQTIAAALESVPAPRVATPEATFVEQAPLRPETGLPSGGAIGPQEEGLSRDISALLAQYDDAQARALENPVRNIVRALGRDVGARFILQGVQKFLDLAGTPDGLEAHPVLREIVDTANSLGA